MENRNISSIFNDLRLPVELDLFIFGFFSPADLRNTSLVSKEFLSLSREKRTQLINYFSNIKLYLDVTREGIAALFSAKNIDLGDDDLANKAQKFRESNNLDALFNLLGVDQEKLITNLKGFIERKFEVTPAESLGVFPEISIVARKNEEKSPDFQASSLELINKLVGLGIEIDLSEDMKRALDPQRNHSF